MLKSMKRRLSCSQTVQVDNEDNDVALIEWLCVMTSYLLPSSSAILGY